MSSPFLSNNSTDFSALQDGSTEILASTLGAANFTPGFPVKINSDQILYPTLLDVSDISGLPSTIGDVISDSSSAVINNIATFNTTNGLHIKDSGVSIGSFGNVTSDSLSSIVGDVVTYNSVNGLHIHDSGTLLSNLATTSQLNSYMPLAGGTFSGPVQFGTNVLTVNHMSTSGLTGQVWGNSSSGSTGGSIVIGDSSTGIGDVCIIGHNSFNTSTSGQSTLIGINNSAAAGATQGICLGFDNVCENNGGQICIGSLNTTQGLNSVCIGSGLINSIANSVLIGATGQNLVNIRPLTNATCDLGATSGSYFNNAYLSGNLVGNTFSRAVDNIVSNVAGSTGSNIAIFSGTSGKLIQDSGILSTNLVSDLGGSTGSNIAVFSGTSGKVIQDTGILSTNLVSNPSGSTGGNFAIFSDTSGKILTDSGFSPSQYLPLAGGTMSGPINMNTNSINGIASENYQGELRIFKGGGAGTNLVIGRVGTTGGAASTSILLNSSSSSIAGANQIVIGNSNNPNTNQYTVIVGDTINSSGFAAINIGGGNNGIGNPQNNSIAIGTDMRLGSGGVNAICLGNAAGTTGTINNAIAIGTSAVNSVASSCLIGDTGITSIYPNNNILCDLGLTGSNFRDLYVSRNITGCTFTGRVDMGTNTLSVNEMSNSGLTGMRWGKGSTHGGTGTIVIGDNSSLSGINEGTVIGKGSISLDTQCTSLGMLNSMNAGSTLSTLVGYNNISGAQGGICIGFSSQSAARNGWCLGHGLTNVTANSLLIGSVEASQNLVNIRPQTNATCDLGTSSSRFNNTYIGNLIQALPSYCSIYNTAATAITMTAATITTLPMVFILNAQSSDFTATLATGIITYTGTPTKLFRVTAVLGWKTSANNQVFQFGITKNSSLSFANSRIQSATTNTSAVVSGNICDIFSLATNDTITLIGDLTVGSSASITFQYCNIVITQV